MHASKHAATGAGDAAAAAWLARLRAQGQYYVAPRGTNDDWYALYACVKARARGLLVSNDELRDHAYELRARPRWFSEWKRRHVLRFVVGRADTGADAAAAGGSNGGNGASRSTKANGIKARLVSAPPEYTRCAQRLPISGAWMLPVAAAPAGRGGDGGGGGAANGKQQQQRQQWLMIAPAP